MTKSLLFRLIHQYRALYPDRTPRQYGTNKERVLWLFGEAERAAVAGRMPQAIRLLGMAQGLMTATRDRTLEEVAADAAAFDTLDLGRPPGVRGVPCEFAVAVLCAAPGGVRTVAVLERTHWVPEAVLGARDAILAFPEIDRHLGRLDAYDLPSALAVDAVWFDYADHSYHVGLDGLSVPVEAGPEAVAALVDVFVSGGWRLSPEWADWAQRWQAAVAAARAAAAGTEPPIDYDHLFDDDEGP